MAYAFTAYDLKDGNAEDLKVEGKRSTLQVFIVKSHLLGDGEVITAVYLRPPREPGHQPMNTLRCAELIRSS